MKKWISIIAVCSGLFVAVFSVKAQDKKYMMMFYNVENLFDTIPSPGVFDEEFTPAGEKKWNTAKYAKKLDNLDEVFYKMAQTERMFPAVIGLAEIENRNVLEDMVSMPRLSKGNYQIVHYDSPDARGVDVAFFYRPDIFRYEGSAPIRTVIPELPEYKTRDIVSMWGTIDGEQFCFFVCHWPSRLGGQAASEFKRVGAAQTVRNAMDSIRILRPETKFVVMGDMNDDPNNRSLAEVLGGKRKVSELHPGDMYNPFWDMLRDGFGTLAYGDVWNLFDNIIVSENLVAGRAEGLKLVKKNKYYGYIFDRPFLKQKSGQYKGYPLRTFVGNDFQGGYSDHLPVYILLH